VLNTTQCQLAALAAPGGGASGRGEGRRPLRLHPHHLLSCIVQSPKLKHAFAELDLPDAEVVTLRVSMREMTADDRSVSIVPVIQLASA
jgi:hypothetical protein